MGVSCATCFKGVTRVVVNIESAIPDTDSSFGGELGCGSNLGDSSWADTIDSPTRSPAMERNWTVFEDVYGLDPTVAPSEVQ